MSMSLGQHPSIPLHTPTSYLLQKWTRINPTRSRRNRTSKLNQFSHLGHHHRRLKLSLCTAAETDDNPPDVRENTQPNNPPHVEGPQDQESFPSARRIVTRLKRYGISGVLSYGLLNTAYYLITFLLVWFYVAPVPGKMGYWAAVKRFVKVMAMVWAGSQVTKIFRAGGALALAPFVDRGLSWFTVKFEFESQRQAFMAIVGCCFGLAALLFFVLTLLWA